MPRGTSFFVPLEYTCEQSVLPWIVLQISQRTGDAFLSCLRRISNLRRPQLTKRRETTSQMPTGNVDSETASRLYLSFSKRRKRVGTAAVVTRQVSRPAESSIGVSSCPDRRSVRRIAMRTHKLPCTRSRRRLCGHRPSLPSLLCCCGESGHPALRIGRQPVPVRTEIAKTS